MSFPGTNRPRLVITLSILLTLAVAEDIYLIITNQRLLSKNEELQSRLSYTKDAPNFEERLGTEAPDFNIQCLDEGDLSLGDFNSDLVIIFFSVDCPGCQQTAENWASSAAERGIADTEVIAVTLDSIEEVWEFQNDKILPLSLCSDSTGQIFKDYRVPGVPLLVWITPEGIIEEYGFF